MRVYYVGPNGPVTEEMVEEVFYPCPRLVAVDTETISLKDPTPLGVAIATSPDEAFYFPMSPEMSDLLPWEVLVSPEVKKIYHNAAFDLNALATYEPDTSNIIDTTVVAHLLNLPAELQLLDGILFPETAGRVASVADVMGECGAKNMLEVDEERLAEKCCMDAMSTYACWIKMREEVDEDYLEVEMRVMEVLNRISRRGIRLDQSVVRELEAKYTQDVEYYLGLANQFGFNPGSPQQVGFILGERRNLLPMTRRRNKLGVWEYRIKTRAEDLEKLDDPMAAFVLNYRKSTKLLGTYIRPWLGEERAYSRFHLDAITGRISSTSGIYLGHRQRNLQNIPAGRPRNMFLPDNGVFTDWDYRQIELRILAHFSQDRNMLRVFDDPNGDIHGDAAGWLGIPRGVAKTVNFGMFYGATDQTIMETAHIRDIEKAREFKREWAKRYPRAWEWIDYQQQEAILTGSVTTMFGRKIAIPQDESLDGMQRKGVNFPIQGSAAEIMKRALVICAGQDIALQVYDEMLVDGMVEVPEEVEWIAPNLHTPVSIKRLGRWE